MVNQPAYIRNLKDYSRAQYGSEDDVGAIEAELRAESDRVVLILSASSIEDSLEMELRNRMPALKADKTAAKLIFDHKGSVATYADKALMAYALGIIDKDTRKTIEIIREIRNACAHSRKPIKLAVVQVSAAVKAAIGDELLIAIKDHEPQSLRDCFVVRCAQITVRIHTGRMPSLDEIRAGLSLPTAAKSLNL